MTHWPGQPVIQPVVEGYGDVEALPVLLRHVLAMWGMFELTVHSAIRRPRGHLVTKEGLQRAVRLGCLNPNCAAVLVVLDADDDCPAELGRQLGEWAMEAALSIPCAVVLANREYEAWFLASLESLRGRRRIADDAVGPLDPDKVRDAKGFLNQYMPGTSPYVETRDQAALSRLIDVAQAAERSRSFRKLLKETQALALRALRQQG